MLELTLPCEPTGRHAGVDEVGRGPWAGPVVAAACVLPPGWTHPWLDDSKKVTALRRVEVDAALRNDPAVDWALAEASVEEIDTQGILQATFTAMRRALASLRDPVMEAIIDGNQKPEIWRERASGRVRVQPITPAHLDACERLRVSCVVGGDASVPAIAAASILAKVHRDELMQRLDALYPGYGLAAHKGYGTAMHQRALEAMGPCPVHRRSFAPVRAVSGA